MGQIVDIFKSIYADGPAGPGANQPSKERIRGELAPILETSIEAAVAGNMNAETWAILAANPGTRSLQPGSVPTTDAGTHTDPVVGGTVANSGSFRWSVSPAGWKRIGNFVDATSAMAAVDALEVEGLDGRSSRFRRNAAP